ncbi:OmpA-like transmembrane domain protein [Candidatus Rickettsiella viridis]|uniref:OmpA-like transmembrane domain protein n=1 Tax=Candidatus Rickettsiella viridis TaxID=676208 RepID=A0A2Z5UUQ6_9COXI|nr:outer membrane beta-barrel protein [Candidatus Rickettsiella viridis]BBB15228.1 OmpA-like transmembrane domain protein [Candidatus Rickettsiella viridis]
MFKKVITTAVLGVSALSAIAANAAVPGPYVTGQLGYANTHMSARTEFGDTIAGMSITDQSSNNLSNNGLAGRLAVGYQLNQNFAVELGYLNLNTGKRYFTDRYFWQNQSLTQSVIDVAGKGILPISDRVNAYGKLGLAYVITTGTYAKVYHPNANGNINSIFQVADHKLAPEAAVGVSYDITPNVSLDTSWTHIQTVGKNRPGNIDFVAVGLGYHFG